MNENRTKESIISDIVGFFKENEDVFNDCIEELDSYNGYLGEDRYYNMYEFDDIYYDVDPLEILCLAYYGYDADNYIIDKYGEKHYDSFNPNRDYFKYNGYGNLISTDYPDYSDYMDKDAIKAMEQNRGYIDTINNTLELCALFDELENAEE